jgi:hypothetical protein
MSLSTAPRHLRCGDRKAPRPTEKHVTSWLTFAPQNTISGRRLLSSRTQPSAALGE